ncbi:MAG: NADH-quinone oxidoreductase subunit C [candidate division Zixibacteria bacterium]|nr:NADH-quinone oxidoreductase subunit C [candidate division Zixibacteria bacterium]
MSIEEITQILNNKFPEKLKTIEVVNHQPAFFIEKEILLDVCKFIKQSDQLKIDFANAIFAVDRTDSLEMVYVLFSLEKRHKLCLKVKLPRKDAEIDSVTPIWEAANWFEREMTELFGIKFKGHPDPRPLLLAEDWNEGYPMLRDWEGKDFIKLPPK